MIREAKTNEPVATVLMIGKQEALGFFAQVIAIDVDFALTPLQV
jgi:hypothetical protein